MNLFTYASSLLDSLNDASNNTVKHLNQNRISCSTLFMQPGVEKQGKSTKSVKNVFPRVENFRHFCCFLWVAWRQIPNCQQEVELGVWTSGILTDDFSFKCFSVCYDNFAIVKRESYSNERKSKFLEWAWMFCQTTLTETSTVKAWWNIKILNITY